MSLLRSRSQPQTEDRSTFSYQQYLGWRYSGDYTTGGNVDTALRNAASNACISVLARTLARTPIDVVKYDGARRVPVNPTPKIVAKPSGIVGASVWRRQFGFSVVTDGNAFGQIVSVSREAWPQQIELLDPAQVTHRRVTKDGVPKVTVDGQTRALWPFGDIWHVPGQLVMAGSPFAQSPLAFASKTIGTSLAVEDYSNRYFTDGAHPTHDIALDMQDPGQAEVDRVKARFIDSFRGSHEPFVHGSGITLNKIQSDPNTTGYIDLLRFEVEQACRFWLVPPSMVYAAVSGQNVTYSNVTQADLHYLKHSLDDYLVSYEEALSAVLPVPQVARANRDAILRADPRARAEIHEIRLRTGTRTINEVRGIEDEMPFDGDQYDEPGMPSQAPPVPDPTQEVTL